MVGEETELNPYLEARSIKAVETDLGEWVAQLAHERPAHLVMPIIHETHQQVGAILAEALGCEISREDVAEQVAVIRVEHRTSFLNAGMSISGANALIAESGIREIIAKLVQAAKLDSPLEPHDLLYNICLIVARSGSVWI